MSTMQIFEKAEFGKVRVVEHEGQPWFVAKDVCECLGLDTSNLSKMLDEDEKGTYTVRTPGGKQEMSIVSEPGLYSLVLRSRKPEAKAFKRWVTHEILPSIRNTGSYALPQTEDEIMAQALAIASKRIGVLDTENEILKTRIALDAPKVELAEAVIATEESISINQFAKVLKQNGLEIGQNRLYEDLRSDGYLMRQKGVNWNMPTQRMMEKGYFRVVERMTEADDGYVFTTVATMITGKGQYHLLGYFLDKYGIRRQLSLFEGGKFHVVNQMVSEALM